MIKKFFVTIMGDKQLLFCSRITLYSPAARIYIYSFQHKSKRNNRETSFQQRAERNVYCCVV